MTVAGRTPTARLRDTFCNAELRRKFEMAKKMPAASVVKDIQHKTRKKYSVGKKIRIVLEGLRGESSIAERCRQECILSDHEREGLHAPTKFRPIQSPG